MGAQPNPIEPPKRGCCIVTSGEKQWLLSDVNERTAENLGDTAISDSMKITEVQEVPEVEEVGNQPQDS